MEDALITSFQNSGSNENPMESLSFAYSKIKISYNPEEEGALKGFIDKGFNVLTVKPW
jgi:type VI protein secretion system component Hcp